MAKRNKIIDSTEDSSSSSDVDEAHISWESSSDTEHEKINQQKVVRKLSFDSFKRISEQFSLNSVNLSKKKSKKCNDKQASFVCAESCAFKHHSVHNDDVLEDENSYKIEEVTSPELNKRCKSRKALSFERKRYKSHNLNKRDNSRKALRFERKHNTGTGKSQPLNITLHKSGNTFINNKSHDISARSLNNISQKIKTNYKPQETISESQTPVIDNSSEITSLRLNISSFNAAHKEAICKENEEISCVSPVFDRHANHRTIQNYQQNEDIIELESSPVLNNKKSSIREINKTLPPNHIYKHDNLGIKSPEFKRHRKQECSGRNVSGTAKFPNLSRKNVSPAATVKHSRRFAQNYIFESKRSSKRDKSCLALTGIQSLSKMQENHEMSMLEENTNIKGSGKAMDQLKTPVKSGSLILRSDGDVTESGKSPVFSSKRQKYESDTKYKTNEKSPVLSIRKHETVQKSLPLSNKKQKHISDAKCINDKSTSVQHDEILRKNSEKCSLQYCHKTKESNLKDFKPKSFKLHQEMMRFVSTSSRHRTATPKSKAHSQESVNDNTGKISEDSELDEVEPCIENVSSQEMENNTREDSDSHTKQISPMCVQKMVLNKHISSQDTSSSTSAVNVIRSEDIVDMDSAKKKKKRLKKGSLAARLQKALARKKSFSNILQYEVKKFGGCTVDKSNWRNVMFTVQHSWIERDRYLLRCSPLSQTGESKSSSVNIDNQGHSSVPSTSKSSCEGVSDSRECILVLDLNIIQLPKLERNSVLSVFPPWECVEVPKFDIRMMFSITHVEVVHSAAAAVSDPSPAEQARVLMGYSCSCVRALRRSKSCRFRLPENGGEIVDLMFGDIEDSKRIVDQLIQLKSDFANMKRDTIMTAIFGIKKMSVEFVQLLINIDKVYRYKEMRIKLTSIDLDEDEDSESVIWAVLGRDVDEDYCEIILGLCPDKEKFVVSYNKEETERLYQLSCSLTEASNDSASINIFSEDHPDSASINIFSEDHPDSASINIFSEDHLDSLHGRVQDSNISSRADTNGSVTCFAVCRDIVGKTLRFGGLALEKEHPYSNIPEYLPFLSKSNDENNKKSNEEKRILYVFSPVPDAFSVRENDDDLNSSPKSSPVVSLSCALKLCEGRKFTRCSLLCVLITFSEDCLYVCDESLSSDYVCVYVNMRCYVPKQVTNNSTSIILLEDITAVGGRLSADKHSWVIPYDNIGEESQLYEDKFNSLRNLKPKISPLLPHSYENNIVELSGNIVGFDEETAYEWGACAVCGKEELEEDGSGRYFCDRCLKVVEVRMKRSLTVILSSSKLPPYEIKVQLLQVSIDRLLGGSMSGQKVHDPMSMLGQYLGPLLCFVTKIRILEAPTTRSFHLREITLAGTS